MSFERSPGLEGTIRRPTARRTILWIGGAADGELAIARRGIACALGGMPIIDLPLPPEGDAESRLPGGDPEPICIVLASDRSGAWSPESVLGIVRRWPLARLVAVTGSLADGRRRSGPPMPGIEEVAWHDLGGRLGTWLADIDSGAPGSLGLPSTARREDRLLDAPTFAPDPPRRVHPVVIDVAAHDATALEGLVDMVRALGHRVDHTTIGRPPLDSPVRLLLWDACSLSPEGIEWLRLLVANRPGLGVVVLESFPRGDVALAAQRAGARAILGRPVNLETLSGTIERMTMAGRDR